MIDPKTARRGLALVFTTLLLDIIGFGIIMPVLPAYLRELTGVGISEAAIEGGWLFFVYAVMQFFFAPIIGGLSDRFGRRPVLLASVLTFSIDNLICAIAWSFPMLFIGRVLAGISGASYSTTSAFIADISNDGNRAKNFGLLGIAFGVGFVIGPVLGGLLGTFGPRVPFFFAAGLAFVNFLIAMFFLPETLAQKHRRRFEWKRANPVGTLLQMRNYPGIGWIGLTFFLMTLGHMMYPAVWSFVSNYRYGWSEQQIGFSLGAFGLCGAIVMATVLMLQLQSFQRLFLVVAVAPLGLIGVVAALLPSGKPLGFVAILGVLALIGILIRNSVILIVQVEEHITEGMTPWDAVMVASQHRMRPIALTAAAASLALIPIAREVFWGPMAYAMMGGIIAGTAITLLFLPALYVTWFRIREPEARDGETPPAETAPQP